MVYDIGRLLKMINDHLRANVDASLKEHHLTFSQLKVLNFVSSQENQTTQKEIEDYLGVAHPTVVGIISRLEKNGFLFCYLDPGNKRTKIVRATKKTILLDNMLSEKMRETDERLIANLSPDEIKELHRMLEIVYTNIC